MLALQLLQLSNHIGVHTTGDLSLLNELVRCGEVEVSLDLMTSSQHRSLIVLLSSSDSLIELSVDLCGQSIGQRVERLGELLNSVECLQLLTDIEQLGVNLSNCLHIYVQLNTHLLTENVDQLQCGSCGTTCEVPDVGINDVSTCIDSSHNRCQTVTRSTVGVEINGNRQILLDQADQTSHALGRNQTTHILDGDHIGTQSRHLLSLIEEVSIGEYGLRILLTHQLSEEAYFGILRINRVANSAISDTAILLNVFDGRFHVIHVVQCVEDTHNAQTALDRVAAETVDNFVGVGAITEQVTATRQSGQFRHVANGSLNSFQTGPRILAKIAHYRVGHCTTPNLHCVEVCVFVERKNTIYLLLFQAGSESRLLAIAQRQISDFKFLCHSKNWFTLYR